jgi:hypothetical protein
MPKFKIPDRLKTGESLDLNQFLQSPNGKYRLEVKRPGMTTGHYSEFVLHEGDTVLWAISVAFGNAIQMLDDGNAIVKNEHNTLFWTAGVKSPKPDPEACLQVLDEGVAVVTAAGVVRWSSHPDKVAAQPLISSEVRIFSSVKDK